jgi:hypothetical protein
MYSFHVFIDNGSGTSGWQGCATRVLRNSTSVFSDEDAASSVYGIASNNTEVTDRHMKSAHYSFIDDHDLSSALTYKVQGWRSQSDGGSISFNQYGNPGRIIVMEIAG